MTKTADGAKKAKGAGVKAGGDVKKAKRSDVKRPTTAFFFYLKENRERFKKAGKVGPQAASAAGEEWRNLQDKSKWEKLAAADKKRYEEEIARDS